MNSTDSNNNLTGIRLKLMEKICKLWLWHGLNSPLCGNTWLFVELESMAKEHHVDFKVALWVSYAESHLMTDYYPSVCSSTLNPAWLKWYKQSTGKILTQPIPDKSGCRLYSFSSIESGFDWLLNTLQLGFVNKGCNSLTCLSESFVKNDGVIKNWRIQRVEYFIYYKHS